MARTALTVTKVTPGGVSPAGTAGTVDGHSFKNTGKEILVIRNTGAGAHVVTVQTPETRDNLPVAERTYNVGVGATVYAGPFNLRTYNQSDDSVYVDYDATPAELSVTVLQVEPV